MPRMTGGQALVESLKREGVERSSGCPGVQLDWAFDALYAERDRSGSCTPATSRRRRTWRTATPARTGKVGTCLVVPGPGVLNAHGGALDRLRLQLAGALHRPARSSPT